jgi:hypothetical protein
MSVLLTLVFTLLGPLALAADAHPLQRALTERVTALALVYDDTHGLWGGTRFEVDAEGTLTRTVTPRGRGEPTRSTVTLTPAHRQELNTLLLTVEVWEQRAEARAPLPDESKATLTVTLDGREAQLWEWYNDLAANDRLVRIKGWLDDKAGAP